MSQDAGRSLQDRPGARAATPAFGSGAFVPSRCISAGSLRAFEAVARHLNFRVAGEELALTQPAVSRQIQALERELGVHLFLRAKRSVALTEAGRELLAAVSTALPAVDAAVRRIRRTARRRTVALASVASLASCWLLPRLGAFQADHPDIDVRIEATQTVHDVDASEFDLLIRACASQPTTAEASFLFAHHATAVASPTLLASAAAVHCPSDLLALPLIEDASETIHVRPTWRALLARHGFAEVQPKRWLYLNQQHDMIQAALAGQGVALAELPLVAHHLASGQLVAALPSCTEASPLGYCVCAAGRSAGRPEVAAFRNWLLHEAAATQRVLSACSARVAVAPPALFDARRE